MTRRVEILCAVLVLQIGLAVSFAFVGRSRGAFRSNEKLIDLKLSSLGEIVIEDEDDPALLIQRKDGSWILPGHFDFPASNSKLERMAGKLFGTTKSWPVGTTAVAAKRFKVADEDFERKITFREGQEDVATLLIGTSPGFKKVHARLAGEDAIYAIDFSTYEASVKPQDWEDKGLLNLEPDEIVRVEMSGISLIRDGDKLRLTDLGEAEEMDPSGVDTLLSKLSKPTFLEVLGTEDKAEYRQDAPVLAYTVEVKSGEAIDYTYSQPKDGEDFILKTSSRPEYFKTSKYSVESLQGLTRAELVREEKAPEAAEEQKEVDSQTGGADASLPVSPSTSQRPSDS